MPSKEIRVALNGKMFRSLVRGGQVTVKRGKDSAVFILQDIGFDLMRSIIDIAEEDQVTKGLVFKDESIEVSG